MADFNEALGIMKAGIDELETAEERREAASGALDYIVNESGIRGLGGVLTALEEYAAQENPLVTGVAKIFYDRLQDSAQAEGHIETRDYAAAELEKVKGLEGFAAAYGIDPAQHEELAGYRKSVTGLFAIAAKMDALTPEEREDAVVLSKAINSALAEPATPAAFAPEAPEEKPEAPAKKPRKPKSSPKP